VRIASLDDRNGFDAGGDDPERALEHVLPLLGGRRPDEGEPQLSQLLPGFSYKLSNGYLEPCGDYFELDIDGAGKTHVLWGEAPSYDDPGTIS
jgi:hypothetical protein